MYMYICVCTYYIYINSIYIWLGLGCAEFEYYACYNRSCLIAPGIDAIQVHAGAQGSRSHLGATLRPSSCCLCDRDDVEKC